MSLYDYRVSLKIGRSDPPFYSLIMAALRKADTVNSNKINAMWPELYAEFAERYHAPAGVIESDGITVQELLAWEREHGSKEEP